MFSSSFIPQYPVTHYCMIVQQDLILLYDCSTRSHIELENNICFNTDFEIQKEKFNLWIFKIGFCFTVIIQMLKSYACIFP